MKLHPILQDWQSDAYYFLRHAVPKIVFILLLSALLIWLLAVLTRRLSALSERKDLPYAIDPHRARQLRTLAAVVYSVGAAVVVFLAAMQLLPLFGIDMKPLLASAGIAGLAIGFGAQTLVRDVLNGFFILVEDQYHLGDVIRIGAVTGTVEDMTLRRTVLRDAEGALHFFPNSEIKVVANLTRDWAQVQLRVVTAYGEDSERVIRLLQQVGREMNADPAYSQAIVAEPQVPGIERVSGGEVEYLLLVKTQPGQQYGVARELRRRIKDNFDKNKIQMPAPARVFVADAESPTETREVT